MADQEHFPVNDLPDGDLISAEIGREKAARQASSLTMHRWWAIRPPIVARIASYLAIIDDPVIDPQILRELAKRVPTHAALTAAHTRIRDAAWRRIIQSRQQEPSTDDRPVIRVLDPFAGSGSIPAEASRLGCDVYAGDLSPVAYSILKCALSFPQIHGEAEPRTSVSGRRKWAGLAVELEQAATRIERRVLDRVKPFFASLGKTPESFWWCRTTLCPTCDRLAPVVERISFRIADDERSITFAQKGGVLVWTMGAASRTQGDRTKWCCALCGAIAARGEVGLADPSASILLAVEHGRRPKLPIILVTPSPAEQSQVPPDLLAKAVASLESECPALKTPVQIGGQLVGRRTLLTFSDLFTHRQLLVGLTFVAEVKQELVDLQSDGASPEQLDALRHYLAFLISDIADRNSVMCDVHASNRGTTSSFTHPAYRQASAFVERFPAGMVADWLKRLLPAIERAAGIPPAKGLYCGSAGSLPFDGDYFDAVVTDPPYLDRIPYSDLSDFYRVWESAILGGVDTNEEVVVSHGIREPPPPKETEERYRAGMLAAFREIYRVLRPGGTLCLLYTSRSATDFEDYLKLCQQAGLEFVNIQKLPEIERGQLAKQVAITLLVYLRKPGQAHFRAPLVAVDAKKLIESAIAGKPVLYGGLANLLDQELDETTKAELIPEGGKGSTLEQLMEVVAGEDPRDVLLRSLGMNGVRRIAKQLGSSAEQLVQNPLEYILEHFCFGVPPALEGREGAKQTSDRLHHLAASIRQADTRSTVTGTFLDACAKIESLLRFGIWSWAEFVFGCDRDATLIGILRTHDAEKAISIDRLTFGHIARLFRELPDRIAQAPNVSVVEQKLGQRHIYKPGDKQHKLGERVDKIVARRNTVEHNKENYRDGTPLSQLKTDLAKVLDEATQLVDDLAHVNAIPRLAVPFEEIRDQWNRLRYRLSMDDGTALTARFSDPLTLGHQYIYLGTATNPMPVDPLILDAKRIGKLS